MSRNPYDSPPDLPPPREKWYRNRRRPWYEVLIWIPLLLIAMLLVSFAIAATLATRR